MKTIKKMKEILVGIILCCILFTNAAYAMESTSKNVSSYDVQGVEAIQPRTMYLRSSSLNFNKITGNLDIIISTAAFGIIEHIYHDVTIYKNGYWYSSNRYQNWNNVELITSIKVPAKSGDFFEVYVDHYTNHNGCLESRSNSRTLVY